MMQMMMCYEWCVRSLLQSGSAVSRVTVDSPDAVICTSKYSPELPYTMGRVVFAVTNDRLATFRLIVNTLK